MKTTIEKRLIWYLKDGTELDIDNPSHVDMYVQQILSHGKAGDIKTMMKLLTIEGVKESFKRVKKFLPKEVRRFWEAGFGDTGEDPNRDTDPPFQFKVRRDLKCLAVLKNFRDFLMSGKERYSGRLKNNS